MAPLAASSIVCPILIGRAPQLAALEDNWLGDIVSRLVFKTTPEKARAQWEASLRNIKAIMEQANV